MWVSQTPMYWNRYFLIKLLQQCSQGPVHIEYVLCRAVKVSPLASSIIQPSFLIGGALPRPQLYTYSACTKHKSSWLACNIIVIQALSACPFFTWWNSTNSDFLFLYSFISLLLIYFFCIRLHVRSSEAVACKINFILAYFTMLI